MKARIKSTGEIIDFLGSSIEYGTCTWIDSKGDFNQGPNPGIEILESGKPIDWEQRRYEIAKDIIVRFITHEDCEVRNEWHRMKAQYIRYAIEDADTIIEGLKKKDK